MPPAPTGRGPRAPRVGWLRCIFDEPPPPEATPTCDTAGVLATAVQVVASFQATEAMKLLMGRMDELHRRLIQIDVWSARISCIAAADSKPSPNCPCCGGKQFPYLEGRIGSETSTLCGRNAVQIRRASAESIHLPSIAEKLRGVAKAPVQLNQYLLRASFAEFELTLFSDGRAIIKGTSDPQRAKAVYAKYVGV